jgi:Uma2 family endonuclease
MTDILELEETAIAEAPRRRRRFPLPLSFEERADMGKREIRVAATFEEYLDFSHDCEYRVHYRNGQIISFIEIDEKTKTVMGEATVTHERLVARMIHFLTNVFGIDSEFQILGSNTKIFIAEDRKGCNPDVAVVKGNAIEKKYRTARSTRKGVSNPHLIVEVLSESTRDFDLSEKLTDYKTIPSLQQIIFLEQGAVWASTYIRQSENRWLNIDFDKTEHQIPVSDGFIGLDKIYSKRFE